MTFQTRLLSKHGIEWTTVLSTEVSSHAFQRIALFTDKIVCNTHKSALPSDVSKFGKLGSCDTQQARLRYHAACTHSGRVLHTLAHTRTHLHTLAHTLAHSCTRLHTLAHSCTHWHTLAHTCTHSCTRSPLHLLHGSTRLVSTRSTKPSN